MSSWTHRSRLVSCLLGIGLVLAGLSAIGGSPPLAAQTCPAGSSVFSIDFEEDHQLNPLVAGDVFNMTTQHYSLYGVTIEIAATSCPGPAMIFDSAAPTGGDSDLGSPNTTCPGGGPGVGSGGASGAFYENCVPVGNVLIISEDGLSANPDDCGAGGILRITFDYDTTIFELGALDVDSTALRPEVLLYDVSDMLLGSVVIPSGPGQDPTQLGDNAMVVQTGIESIGADQVRRMDFSMPQSGSIDSFTFCKDDAFVPVTLAYFGSTEVGGEVLLEWATATEVGNLGFNLFVQELGGDRRLNADLIPSLATDSTTPLHYGFSAWGVAGDSFLLEDVDIFGKSRFHGPFRLGEAHGQEPAEAEPIDWRRPGQPQLTAHGAAPSALRAAPAASDSVKLRGRSRRRRAKNRRVNLLVDEDGLYRVTHEDLLAVGIDLSGTPINKLSLRNGGSTVPIRVTGRRRFRSGSYVEFLGKALDTLYTRTNVYTLEVKKRRALRIHSDKRSIAPLAQTPGFYIESRQVELNRAYSFAAPGSDPWYDSRVLATSGPIEAAFDIELDERVESAGPVRLEVALWGVTNFPQEPDHHVVLGVNGVDLADEWFDGLVDHPISLEVPDSLLEPTGNTLHLALPHDTGAEYDLVNYDHYRVSYPRRFQARGGQLSFSASAKAFRVDGLPSADVVVYREQGGRLERLSKLNVAGVAGDYSVAFIGSSQPATYHVASIEGLRRPGFAAARSPRRLTQDDAELLVIAHPSFVEAIEPLVAARRAQGLTVKIVDVEDVYAKYSGGIFDPAAIRELIRQAHLNMGTESVLLVGGDTYDYLDFLGLGSISFIPTLYARTDRIVHFAPVDPLYADVDHDNVPDLAIGRLPVRTVAELDAVIEKILAYESIGYAGTAVLAADDADVATSQSFSEASNEIAALLPGGWLVERAYMEELGLDGARQMLFEQIGAGVALTSYFGHSGPSVWSFQGLFDSADAAGLDNFGRPTVVTQWGCWNTYHVAPTYDTLGQELLLNPSGGAAAVLGASTLTATQSERQLGRLIFERLGRPGVSLGAAVVDAKRELAKTQPELLDVLLGWTLLGDPTQVVQP